MYQLTKIQIPNLNTFQDVLLKSLNCWNFRRAITPEKKPSEIANGLIKGNMGLGEQGALQNTYTSKKLPLFCAYGQYQFNRLMVIFKTLRPK